MSKRTRKLNLSKETVRHLKAGMLSHVRVGLAIMTMQQTCSCNSCVYDRC